MALDKKCAYFIHTYTYCSLPVWWLSGTATRGDTGGTEENKVCNKLCPMKKEAGILYHESNRVGQEAEGAGEREKSRLEPLLGQER